MKKMISLFLCGVFVSAFVLSGCNSSKDETKKTRKSRAKKETKIEEIEPDEDPAVQDDFTDDDPSYDDTSSDDYTYADESFNFADHSFTYLDGDKLQQVADLYDTKVPDHRRVEQVVYEGIPGSGCYSVWSDSLYFSSDSVNGQSSIEIRVDMNTETASVTFQLYYDDDRYYGCSYTNQRIDLNGFESFIDSVSEGDTNIIELYDDSALPAHAEDVKKDIPIVYSRLITVADNAFPELGFGLEDLGIDLGSKYRSIDPTAPTSQEHFAVNEHVFVNGVCSDCGMLWTEYYYEAIGIADNDMSDGWRSIYGQDSSYMFEPGDYVQLSSHGDDADIFFHHSDDNWNDENCRIMLYEQNGRLVSYINFEINEGMYSIERGLVGFKFRYDITVSAELGEYDKVFASKETIAENCEMYLFVTDDDGIGHDVWGSKTDDEIRAMFDEVDNCTYYTKDEILDMIWEHLENYFNSMDDGMVMLGTNLADAGINWK